MVRAFQDRHGFPSGLAPGDDPRTDMVRLHLIAEEGVAELALALGERDRVKVTDALADLLYVTLGAANTWDVPLAEAFDEVHRSNMTKAVRRPGDTRLRDKGDSYSPADLARVVREHDAAGGGGVIPLTAEVMWRTYAAQRLSTAAGREACEAIFTREFNVPLTAHCCGADGRWFAVVSAAWDAPEEYQHHESWMFNKLTKLLLDDLGRDALVVFCTTRPMTPRWAARYDPGLFAAGPDFGHSFNVVPPDLAARGGDVFRVEEYPPC